MKSLRTKIIVGLIIFSLGLGVISVSSSNASAWSGSFSTTPSSAYIGDTLTYNLIVKNTGEYTLQIFSATLTIDWGAIVTTRSMTGDSALAVGESGTLTCSFTIPSITPNIYLVKVQVSGQDVGDWWAGNKTYTSTLTVKEVPDLSLSVQSSSTSGQAPFSVDFSSIPNGGVSPYTYYWTFGDGSSSAMQSTSYTYSQGGTYTATCIVRDTKGQTASDSVTITVTNIPLLSVNVESTTTSGKAPLSPLFKATPSGGAGPYTFYWTFGDGGVSSLASVSHQYAKEGTFTAKCLVTDVNGQTSSDSVIITVLGDPIPFEYLLISIAVIVIAVVVVGFLMVTRRKSDKP